MKSSVVTCLLGLGSLGLLGSCASDPDQWIEAERLLGSDASDQGGSCSLAEGCGGDVVGTWQVDDLCLDETGAAAGFAGDLPDSCADAYAGVSARFRNLTLEYTASGTTTTNGAMELTVRFDLSSSCLADLASDASNEDAACEAIEDDFSYDSDQWSVTAHCSRSGSGCSCEQVATGGTSGNTASYTATASTLRQRGSTASYCVRGDELTLSVAGFAQYHAHRR